MTEIAEEHLIDYEGILRKPQAKITEPKIFELKDGTKATVYPVYSADEVPKSLIKYLTKILNREIANGQTYPNYHEETEEEFAESWFFEFVGIVLKGETPGLNKDTEHDWDSICLGTYFIKPNFVYGRCSHICNGGFVVNPNTRANGVGKILGKSYLECAKVLGYTYSMFNLVFASNFPSQRTWEGLGFDRIGLIPGAIKVKGRGEPVDAIMYGKKLI